MTSAPMTQVLAAPSSLDDLFRELAQIEGKAEIVDERIVIMSPTGVWPSLVALEIAVTLRGYVRATRRGVAVGDNATFRVDLPHRQSFSPDAAYFTGKSGRMGPFDGTPAFAVEVRSSGDYGPRAERLLADKREDYFAAGTQVVWDVDLQSLDVIRMHTATEPTTPVIFHPTDIAHAEPAVPGWTVAVRELLPEDWTPPATP